MQFFAEKLANSLWQLEKSGNDTRSGKHDVSELEFVSAPTLTQNHEVRELAPQLHTQLHEEGVSILLHRVSMPIAVVLISNHDFTI
jgi:hypothetical protein